MKKLFLIVVLLAAAPALMAQPEGTKAVRGEEWAEVGPGLDERVRPGAEVEYRARGAAGLQLLLDGLRAQLEGLPADSRRRQAIERMEEQLNARADAAAKSSQAVCAPITRKISAQYASFYPGSGCTGREHEVDVFGTWDGQGCVVDIYVPGNLAQCGIQTLPSTVKSYRTPAGDCIECPHGSPLYSGECDSNSDAMPVYRNTECCVDSDCPGEVCRYGQCMECLEDSDCPSGQLCNASRTCYIPCPPCAPGETCIDGVCVAPSCTPNPACSGRSCSVDSDCDNNGCPSSCSFGQCLCAW